MSHPMPEALERLLGAATAGLDAAAHGVPVCIATKAGRAAPGVKYHEGRWAALTEVARQCRRTSEDAADVASEVRRAWVDELSRLIDHAAGADWVAYREGGNDALADLLSLTGRTADAESSPGSRHPVEPGSEGTTST